ncbi:MAG: hypothetical protein JST68_11385 [Bacteroidetes bacterium]|nr:hypothetical protein [Bacteroidota bacterium]
MQLVIPMIAYEDGVAAIEWLCRVFGFTEQVRWLDDHGRLSHGEIAIGDQLIMLASPTPGYQSPKRLRQEYAPAALWYQTPYIINGVLVYVEDVESHFKTASELGALILTGIEHGGPGTRYRAEDLEGQRWMFMQRP